MSGASYKDAGVDIDAGARAVSMMKAAVEATHGPEVLAGVGAFGGLFDAGALQGMGGPTLVASTDGVGTKTKIAAAIGRFDTIGHDIVNHCVNDILVQGARPLFFLDYVAANKLVPEVIAAIVTGAAEACKGAGCALLGGETAEMPGVYAPGEFDLVGTIVGAVDRARLVTGERIAVGDKVVGLASSGLHTNGFTLARHLIRDLDLKAEVAELGGPLGEVLLAPHRGYVPDVDALEGAGVDIKGLAHITGGGLVDNPPRILADGLAMQIDWGSWPVPALFQWLQARGPVAWEEMVRVFNVGLGMLVVLPAEQAQAAVEAARSEAWVVGEIVAAEGEDQVVFSGQWGQSTP